jgi:hypothetical protein
MSLSLSGVKIISKDRAVRRKDQLEIDELGKVPAYHFLSSKADRRLEPKKHEK